MSATTPETRRIYPGIDQLTLRTLVVLGTAVAVVAAQAAGARVAPWEQGMVFGLAVLTAVRPESVAGVGLLASAAYVWVLAPEALSPLVLVAAAGMILVHVSALVAAQGPARMAVDGAQVRRWAARALLLWLVAVAVWGFSVAVADLSQGRLVYALGLVLLTVGALAANRLLATRAEG